MRPQHYTQNYRPMGEKGTVALPKEEQNVPSGDLLHWGIENQQLKHRLANSVKIKFEVTF